MKSILMIASILLVGCATSSKNFKVSSVNNEKEGMYFGNVKIVMDGEVVTSNCYFQTEDENENKAHINVSESGMIIGKLGKGKNHLRALFCRRGMTNNNYVFKDDQIYFNNAGNGKATYFGDLAIYWYPGSMNPWLFLLGGGVAGAVGTEAKNIVFSKSDKLDSVKAEVEKLLNVKLDVTKSIFNFPDGRLVSNEQAAKIEDEIKKNK